VFYENSEALMTHLQDDHGMDVQFSDVTCPLCVEFTSGDRDVLSLHIARHMEEIALAILPTGVDSDEESTDESTSDATSIKDNDNSVMLRGEFQEDPTRYPSAPRASSPPASIHAFGGSNVWKAPILEAKPSAAPAAPPMPVQATSALPSAPAKSATPAKPSAITVNSTSSKPSILLGLSTLPPTGPKADQGLDRVVPGDVPSQETRLGSASTRMEPPSIPPPVASVPPTDASGSDNTAPKVPTTQQLRAATSASSLVTPSPPPPPSVRLSESAETSSNASSEINNWKDEEDEEDEEDIRREIERTNLKLEQLRRRKNNIARKKKSLRTPGSPSVTPSERTQVRFSTGST
jgi:hypothetical protein